LPQHFTVVNDLLLELVSGVCMVEEFATGSVKKIYQVFTSSFPPVPVEIKRDLPSFPVGWEVVWGRLQHKVMDYSARDQDDP
jgi:hypothetical protein